MSQLTFKLSPAIALSVVISLFASNVPNTPKDSFTVTPVTAENGSYIVEPKIAAGEKLPAGRRCYAKFNA